MPSKEDLDSFWDIEKLVPTKKSSTISKFSTKEKTVTVNVAGEETTAADNLKITIQPNSDEGVEKREATVYYPNETLIKKVVINHVPDKFDFHANFVKAAEIYFNFVGSECEFAQFYSYMPQYTQLTQAQKNYYFYWRTMLRRGKYIKTDYSYFYLYVYEILNLPHLIPAQKGLDLLVDAWKNYRKSLPNIDSNMALWVQDFCLVYNLSAPMEQIGDFIFDIMSVTKFKEFYFSSYETFGKDGVSSLVAYLSDYDWRKGKYAGGDNKEAYTKHLMGAMGIFLEKLFETNAFGMDNGTVAVREDLAFRFALTTCPIKYRIKVEYRKIAEEPEVRELVTSALKYTENKLRALLGVKSRLAVKNFDAGYAAIIDAYFEKLFAAVNRERMRALRPEYEKLYEAESSELSIHGADEIEKASWQTTARLVATEDEESQDESVQILENDVSESSAEQCEQPEECESSLDSYGLSESEAEFLRMALSEDFSGMRALCERFGTFDDAIAEKINEAFADNFGDVVLENIGDGYTVISDYREDIENWLTKITR
ncbi:MAG: TerB N-terminal domain-containing protein [Clostridia bacterium]|nr:TerB N-terminal domain-containing protein [Clostridia bacterium]